MTTVTTFSAVFFLLLSAIIGWVIGWYFQKNKGGIWESKFKAIESERSNLINDLKKEKKSNGRLSQQKETWQSKFEASESKYVPMVERYKNEMTSVNTRMTEMELEQRNLKAEIDRKAARIDQLEKEYEKLKEKYATDMADSKGWKNKRDALVREAKDYRAKYERTEKETEVLRERIANAGKSIKDAQAVQAEFRKMKAKTKKLEADIAYWEKKHYDTHHELAAATTKIESLSASSSELDMLMKGQAVKEENMMKKIEEFKTKFVNVNNQYHELLNSQKGSSS